MSGISTQKQSEVGEDRRSTQNATVFFSPLLPPIPQSAIRIPQSQRSAFTLVEVLLAMLLSTVLLGTLWTALNLHLKAFDTGRSDVEQSRMVRAVLRKLETDLRNTIEQAAIAQHVPAVSTTSPAAETEVYEPRPGEVSPLADEQASLVGGPRQLRLRVRTVGKSQPVASLADLDSKVVRLPDDLQTVHYWLANPEFAEGPTPAFAVPKGEALVRRAGPWLRYRDVGQVGQSFGVSDPAGATMPQHDLQQFYRSELPWQESGHEDGRLVVVGEISGLRFRYFDGASWKDDWDSAKLKNLPAAVEVSLLIRGDEPDETKTVEEQVGDQFGQQVRASSQLVVLLNDPGKPSPPVRPFEAPPASFSSPAPGVP